MSRAYSQNKKVKGSNLIQRKKGICGFESVKREHCRWMDMNHDDYHLAHTRGIVEISKGACQKKRYNFYLLQELQRLIKREENPLLGLNFGSK